MFADKIKGWTVVQESVIRYQWCSFLFVDSPRVCALVGYATFDCSATDSVRFAWQSCHFDEMHLAKRYRESYFCSSKIDRWAECGKCEDGVVAETNSKMAAFCVSRKLHTINTHTRTHRIYSVPFLCFCWNAHLKEVLLRLTMIFVIFWPILVCLRQNFPYMTNSF